MDFNDLYHRHQVALFMADNAPSAEDRDAHRRRTNEYASRIAEAKRTPRKPLRSTP